MFSLRNTFRGCAAALSLVLTLAGCSSEGGGNGATPAAATGAAADAVAAASKKVEEYSSAAQQFPVPTESFDPGQGKAAVIAFGSSVEVVQQNAARSVDAFKAMGWDVTGPLDGQFSPPVIGGLVDSAVQEGARAIVLTSVNIEDTGEAIKNALRAGVTVSCVMCPLNHEYADLGVLYATVDFEAEGQILGWYLIERSQGSGTVVNTVDPGSRATVNRAAGVRSIVQQHCPGCRVLDDLVIPSADIAQPGPPQWSAFLSAHPDGITDAVGMADVLGVPMAKTLTDVGRTDVAITGYDADPEALHMIGAGNTPYSATVALPYHWADWAGADLAARKVAGVATYDATKLPVRLLTAKDAGNFSEFTPEGDWQAAFKGLWGIR
ncbi:substrate-binding domain-containing protein [Saccharomonospora sp. NPDC046836]|uniref:sugar ABC transporter substrate-binding protein n=1 Tax=Saccharomonospora sp. NPDC046836 TaxID=3156921 RepID=UPI0033E35974